jgi:hypothetical protein
VRCSFFFFHSLRSQAWDLAIPYGDSHLDSFMQVQPLAFLNYVPRKPSHEADRRTPSTLSRRSLCSAPTESSSPTKGFSSCRSTTSVHPSSQTPSSPQLSPSH